MANRCITMLDIGHNGRLGNQMYQWAVLRSLSLKYNLPIYLPIYRGDFKHTFRLDEAFNLPFFDINNLIINVPINIQEKSFHYDNINLDGLSGIINIKGYFQSYKYFIDYNDIIRNDFKFQGKITEKCDKYLKEIKSDKLLVSIHIRRGDYLDCNHSHAYNFFGVDYCNQAIKYMEDKLDKPFQIIYFSDDIEWCKDNLPKFEDTVFSQNSDIEDLCLMSKCDHNIITNSSFSWWAAWLNDNPKKIIIGPKDWFKLYFSQQIGYIQDDFIPKNWILI